MSWNERAQDTIVVILGGGRGSRLEPLTRLRSKPAVPFAGKYRLIDIPISNAIHSKMERMFVLTQYNSVSLHRHLVWTYKFDIFSSGFVQLLAAQQTLTNETWFQGTADAVRRNERIIGDTRGDFVLILAGDHLYRMDYRQMLRTHIESGADITVAALPCSEEQIADFGAVRTDADGQIVEFREKPKTAAAREGMEADPALLAKHGLATDRPYLASMGIYLFNKSTLHDVLDNDLVDFGHDVIPAAVDRGRVQAHFFDGYWRDIGTVRAFYDAHMDLVRPDPPFDFFDQGWPFYTHPRYLPGSRLRNCRFDQAVLAGGSIISDSTVEESVIGIRTAMEGATVRRSLLMGCDPHHPDYPNGRVGRGTLIEGAIIDKNVFIGENVRIVNEQGLQEGRGEHHVIRDGVVVVPHNTVIPDGTVI